MRLDPHIASIEGVKRKRHYFDGGMECVAANRGIHLYHHVTLSFRVAVMFSTDLTQTILACGQVLGI